MALSRSDFVALLAALGATGLPQGVKAAQPPWYPLPPPERIGKGRALVLSGGGARGAYEAGALKWLFRDADTSGSPFDVVCGTSAGAINAAFAACGTYEAVKRNEQFWRDMPEANILQFIPAVRDGMNAAAALQESAKHGYPRKLVYFGEARNDINDMGSPQDLIKIMGLISADGIHNLIKKYPLGVDNLRTSLVVTATNVTDIGSDAFYAFLGERAAERQLRFLQRAVERDRFARSAGTPALRSFRSRCHELTPENFISAILASASVPGAFQPVPVAHSGTNGANLYVDGGVANNTPITLAADAGANDITVLMVSSPDEGIPKPPQTLLQLISVCYTLMQNKILENDLTLAFTRNLLARHPDFSGLSSASQAYLNALQEKDWRPITLRVIRPRSALEVSVMAFDDAKGIDAAFETGYRDAQEPYVYTIT